MLRRGPDRSHCRSRWGRPTRRRIHLRRAWCTRDTRVRQSTHLAPHPHCSSLRATCTARKRRPDSRRSHPYWPSPSPRWCRAWGQPYSPRPHPGDWAMESKSMPSKREAPPSPRVQRTRLLLQVPAQSEPATLAATVKVNAVAAGVHDRQIAQRLDDEGFVTGMGKRRNLDTVRDVRSGHRIPSTAPSLPTALRGVGEMVRHDVEREDIRAAPLLCPDSW